MEEKVKAFDRKLEVYEDFSILMAKVGRFLIEGIWAGMFFIPIQEYDKDMRMVILFGTLLSFSAISMYLNIYINIQETKQTMSIYRKLRYCPVDMKEIFLTRLRYLLRYCKIKLMVYLLIQMMGAVMILRTYSVWNLVYPLLWVLITNFILGVLLIFPWNINIIRLTDIGTIIIVLITGKNSHRT